MIQARESFQAIRRQHRQDLEDEQYDLEVMEKDGCQSEMPSPLIMCDDDGEENECDQEEDMQAGKTDPRISTELNELLQQQIRKNEGPLPGFLTSQLSTKPKLSWRERIGRFLANFASGGGDHVREPLIPLGMMSRREQEVTAHNAPVLASFARASSRDPLLSKSTEQLVRSSHADMPLGFDDDDLLHEKYRECLRNAKTSLQLSHAQVKELYKTVACPIEPLQGEKRPKACFLLPLNQVSKAVVVDQDKLNVGRLDETLFSTRSRVVSRHHCQIFRDANQLYVYDVGSQGGTFINGERLSDSGKLSATRRLEHLDILQLGADYAVARDPNGTLDPQYCAPQFLVLLGHPKRKEITGRNKKAAQRPLALKKSKLSRLMSRAKQLPMDDKLGAFRLYFEQDTLLGESTAGHAIFVSPELGQYTLVFNNYQVNWYVIHHLLIGIVGLWG
jgi:hypothetical protein